MRKNMVIAVLTAAVMLVSAGVLFAQQPADVLAEGSEQEAVDVAPSVIPDELVGKWSIKSKGKTYAYEFTADGRMLFSLDGVQQNEQPSNVSVSGNTITLTNIEGGGGSAEYKINKGTLEFSKFTGTTGFMKGKHKKEA